MEKLFDIIFEDSDLLVIDKPAGLVCHPTKNGEMSSLIGRVRLYLGADKPAHIINRLDRETSGVVVVAKNPEAAGRLGKLWESRAVQKEYLAIVHGTMGPDTGTIDFPLGKDESSIIAVKDCVRSDGAAAVTEFAVERRFQHGERAYSLVRVRPRTGRKHQIRIHFAAVGHPLVGDKLYGGNPDLYLALAQNRLTERDWAALILEHQALHACSLEFEWGGVIRRFEAAPHSVFKDFLSASMV